MADTAREALELLKAALTPSEHRELYEGTFQMLDERYYVIAPNHVLFQRYCENREIPRSRAHYIDTEEKILSLSKVTIAIVDRDKHGSFDWSQSKRRIIDRALERSKMKIIDCEWVSIDR